MSFSKSVETLAGEIPENTQTSPYMAPPVESFPVSQLEQRVQITADGRRRKGQAIKLKNCELLEMAQYKCKLGQDSKVNVRDAIIICKEFARLFRR